MPEVRGGAGELDANGPFAIGCGLHVDDAAFLLLEAALIHDAERLTVADAAFQDQEAAMGVYGHHLGGFAEGFSLALKSGHFDRDG
ncbi:MAG: hypothetical protein WBE20_09750 [Candidatus Acidiferrales bacterium]